VGDGSLEAGPIKIVNVVREVGGIGHVLAVVNDVDVTAGRD
jgi:hypothetical protein